jgi:hypothetical protein
LDSKDGWRRGYSGYNDTGLEKKFPSIRYFPAQFGNPL